MHPYQSLPDHAYWRRAVAAPAAAEVDPVVSAAFRLRPEDQVVTAGSCFAQHIARHLKANGLSFLVTEPAHAITPAGVAESFNYGVFSARYGNVYTTRQLLQLFKRAYGQFQPVEQCWVGPTGGCHDPFRPQIQPGGFETEAELLADQRHHLACVRKAFETMTVFVFTLGLTEVWLSREDGAAFPVCPGVAAGTFDPARHVFRNMSVSEVVEDVREFARLLEQVNPGVKILLTVSPVPLMATAVDRHVLTSTAHSKAVLRVAADQLAQDLPNVHYFPSYEIITGPHARGRYFAEDLRSVTEEGVSHVMRLFLRHYAGIEGAPAAVKPVAEVKAASTEVADLIQVLCDEELLDSQPTQAVSR